MKTLNDLRMALVQIPRREQLGQVAQVVGLLVESIGPHVSVGDLCFVDAKNGNDAYTGASATIIKPGTVQSAPSMRALKPWNRDTRSLSWGGRMPSI